ncbi:30S ribosomal protein S10 [Candidatus Gracilibacteria bacterium]|jgi:small subunit ribosomal protein S10|nr:30S ribosomal protein S10 [Candidatus Gracilibacteria bacterium]
MTAKAKATSSKKETAPKAAKATTKKAPLKEAKVSTARKETLKISVKAFEHRVVDEAVKKIVSAAKDTGSQTVGPIPLPTKIEKFTLNRSTFVNKNAREQFEIRRHRRLLLINEPTPETLETLQKLNLPSGVGVDIAIVAAA